MEVLPPGFRAHLVTPGHDASAGGLRQKCWSVQGPETGGAQGRNILDATRAPWKDTTIQDVTTSHPCDCLPSESAEWAPEEALGEAA